MSSPVKPPAIVGWPHGISRSDFKIRPNSRHKGRLRVAMVERIAHAIAEHFNMPGDAYFEMYLRQGHTAPLGMLRQWPEFVAYLREHFDECEVHDALYNGILQQAKREIHQRRHLSPAKRVAQKRDETAICIMDIQQAVERLHKAATVGEIFTVLDDAFLADLKCNERCIHTGDTIANHVVHHPVVCTLFNNGEDGHRRWGSFAARYTVTDGSAMGLANAISREVRRQ